MPKSKIAVGMPLYGKAWTLPSSARNGKTPGPGMFAQGVDQVGWTSIILYSITQKMLKADGSIDFYMQIFGWSYVLLHIAQITLKLILNVSSHAI